MPITGYLKIEGVDGESLSSQHENEMEVFEISWGVEQVRSSQSRRGRTRARPEMEPVVVQKHIDAASAYLAQACHSGRVFDEVTLSVIKDIGGAHLDYLVIKMENATISSYDLSSGFDPSEAGQVSEEITMDYERLTYTYTQQQPSGAAGEEHQVTLSAV